jgi:hypothetical protein
MSDVEHDILILEFFDKIHALTTTPMVLQGLTRNQADTVERT